MYWILLLDFNLSLKYLRNHDKNDHHSVTAPESVNGGSSTRSGNGAGRFPM